MLLVQLEGYWEWMQGEPRLSGLFPWCAANLFCSILSHLILYLSPVLHSSLVVRRHWYYRNMTGEQQYSLGIVQFPRLVARYKQIGHAFNVKKTDDHSAATPLLPKASDEQPQGAAVRALLEEVRALRSELALERQERQADAREFRAALRRSSTGLGAREGPVPPLPGVTGNGSAGRVAKFVGASTIAASRIVEVPQTNPAWAYGAARACRRRT